MRLAIYYAHLIEAARESGKPMADICAEARAAGIEAVDLMHEELTDKSLPDYASFGFALSGVPVWFDFARKPFGKDDLAFLEDLKRGGATRCLLLPAQFAPGDDREALMGQILDGTAAVAEACQAAGIAPTLEPFGSSDVPFHTVAELRRFLDAIPSLGITIDTGNFYWSDTDLLEAYAALKDRVNYVHAKDYGPMAFNGEAKNVSDAGVAFYGCPIGAGRIPVAKVFRELVRDGYDGTIVMELSGLRRMEPAIIASSCFVRDEWAKAIVDVKKRGW